jgi:putative FmdB family regulatory protein
LPLYEYHCPKDGTFELVRKFSDPPLEACPTCAGPIEKLVSAPAIQFKGTGWYITDYARKSTGGEAAGNKDVGKKDGGKKDGGKADGGKSESSKDSSAASASSDSKASASSSSGSGKSSSGSDKK